MEMYPGHHGIIQSVEESLAFSEKVSKNRYQRIPKLYMGCFQLKHVDA